MGHNGGMQQIHWTLTEDETPKGTVLLSHGVAEHMGRYKPLRTALVEAGYDIAFYDHAGHGSSPGPRACVDVGRLIRDHMNIRRHVLAEARHSDLFLFGHSMGGLITAASALIDPKGLRGVVLTGPAFRPLPELPVDVAHSLSQAARLTPRFPVHRIPPDPTASRLSRDPNVQRAFNADPLCHHGSVPLLTAATVILQAQQVRNRAQRWRLPLLIFHGSADTLCALSGSRDFVQQAVSASPSVDVHLRVIDGARHEVLNEPEGPSVIRDIVLWLGTH